MYCLCKHFIILSFLAVLSTNAQECGAGAQCVVVEECRRILIAPSTNSTIDRNVMEQSSHCGFNERNQSMICCPPVLSDYPVSTSAPQASPSYDRTAALGLLPEPGSCGVQRVAAKKIYRGEHTLYLNGGEATAVYEHPWMAMIRYNKLEGSGFHCGGALISSRYVLTAAHCIKDSDLPEGWKVTHVRLGEWDASSDIDCSVDHCNEPPLDVPVEEIIVHEDYASDDNHQQNDIALLRLAYNVTFNDFVKLICLPTDPSLAQNTFEGAEMEVAGWGQTETGSFSPVKLKVRVPVMSNTICARIYQNFNREITDQQICAGGTGPEDSCRGDSGGPLMGRGLDGNWMVLGVVSYGATPCGSRDWPGVYTRVTSYVDWILSKLRP